MWYLATAVQEETMWPILRKDIYSVFEMCLVDNETSCFNEQARYRLDVFTEKALNKVIPWCLLASQLSTQHAKQDNYWDEANML